MRVDVMKRVIVPLLLLILIAVAVVLTAPPGSVDKVAEAQWDCLCTCNPECCE